MAQPKLVRRTERPRISLAALLHQWLTPRELRRVREARETAPDDGEPTDRFTERERLIALGAIRPSEQRP